jgi:hypothetical protein
MEEEISDVAVQIVRFLDPHNPGVVECKLIDAEGVAHTFVDKVTIFTTDLLDAQSAYPQLGSIRCRVMAQWLDSKGRSLVRISTLWPDGIESSEGLSEFVVLPAQLSPGSPAMQAPR